MAYIGINVTYGRGLGVVAATGMNTKMGKIAKELSGTEKELTPLQKKLNQISNVLSIGVIVIAITIFIIGLLGGKELLEVFLILISLAAPRLFVLIKQAP